MAQQLSPDIIKVAKEYAWQIQRGKTPAQAAAVIGRRYPGAGQQAAVQEGIRQANQAIANGRAIQGVLNQRAALEEKIATGQARLAQGNLSNLQVSNISRSIGAAQRQLSSLMGTSIGVVCKDCAPPSANVGVRVTMTFTTSDGRVIYGTRYLDLRWSSTFADIDSAVAKYASEMEQMYGTELSVSYITQGPTLWPAQG